MTSTPFKTATHVLIAATIIVTGLGGLALLAPPINDRQSTIAQVDVDLSQPLDQNQADAPTIVSSDPNTNRSIRATALHHPSRDESARLNARDDPPEPPLVAQTFEVSERKIIESRLWSLQQQIDRLALPHPPAAESVEESEAKAETDHSRRTEENQSETARSIVCEPTGVAGNPTAPELQTTVASAATDARQPVSVLKGERCEGRTDRYTIELQNADIREALMMLSQLTKQNVIVAPGVRGNIAAVSLQEISAEDALTAITKSLGLITERDGTLAYVTPPEELRPRERGDRNTILKIYRPRHISVQELESLVTPLLSKPMYLMALRHSLSSSGVASAEHSVPSDGLLIVDDPQVIARIDQLISEVDQPAVLATRPDVSAKNTQSTPPQKRMKQAEDQPKSGVLRKISGTTPQRFSPPESATELPRTPNE